MLKRHKFELHFLAQIDGGAADGKIWHSDCTGDILKHYNNVLAQVDKQQIQSKEVAVQEATQHLASSACTDAVMHCSISDLRCLQTLHIACC
eukprot:15701011-Heterocapsa_arctica.AAC.1